MTGGVTSSDSAGASPSGEAGSKASARGAKFANWLPMVFLVTAIWLAYQILMVPVASRAPPSLAVRLNPGSAVALTRAAEQELVAANFENAQSLADTALRKAPFNVRALSISGTAADQLGDTDRANEMMTLAGNWSLRDDPTHAWLIVRRAEDGDLPGAFAHADTLLRRGKKTELLFSMLQSTAVQEPRSVPVLVSMLKNEPPWSGAFFTALYQSPEGGNLAVALAAGLHDAGSPLADQELSRVYVWMSSNASAADVLRLRQHLGRPPLVDGNWLASGGFDQAEAIAPFDWKLGTAPGLLAEITSDNADGSDPALRVSYSGNRSPVLVSQFVVLEPQRIVLSGKLRNETGEAQSGVVWTLSCFPLGGRRPMTFSPMAVDAPDSDGWQRFEATLDASASPCEAHTLNLSPKPDTGRRTATFWLDDLVLNPSGT